MKLKEITIVEGIEKLYDEFFQSLEDAGVSVERQDNGRTVWIFLKPDLDDSIEYEFINYLEKLRANVAVGYSPDPNIDVIVSYDIEDEESGPVAIIFKDLALLAFRGVQEFLKKYGGRK